jgi:hypothetical protein
MEAGNQICGFSIQAFDIQHLAIRQKYRNNHLTARPKFAILFIRLEAAAHQLEIRASPVQLKIFRALVSCRGGRPCLQDAADEGPCSRLRRFLIT